MPHMQALLAACACNAFSNFNLIAVMCSNLLGAFNGMLKSVCLCDIDVCHNRCICGTGEGFRQEGTTDHASWLT